MAEKFVGIVSLYHPTKDVLQNIMSYYEKLDAFIMMDDSEYSNRALCATVFGSLSDKLIYHWNGSNIGLCASMNKGVKIAMEMDARWILIMDSDSGFENNIIQVYKDYIDNNDVENVALLFPQYNYPRHKRTIQDGVKSSKNAMLSGTLFNVKAFENVGVFDERFYMDGLDYEWCYRARQKKYILIQCLGAVINHNPAHEHQLRIGSFILLRYGWDTPERYYYQFKSMRMMHFLYHDLMVDIHALYKPLKAFFLFKNKKDYLRVWKKAQCDFKRGYFGKYEEV